MKEMMQLLKEGKTTNSEAEKSQRQSKREERKKKLENTPACKHCGKKHPSKKEDECWELESNKASRPSNWKSTKST